MISILIVDDDRALCRSLEIQLSMEGYTVRSAFNAMEGLSLSQSWKPDLVLLDVNLPDHRGLDVLPDFFKEEGSSPTVIVMTAEADNRLVVEAMRNGAFDYLRKPLDISNVFSMIKKVEKDLKKKTLSVEDDFVESAEPTYEMIGEHKSILEIHKLFGLLSRSKVTVLIQGESGTGKELAARILHESYSPGKPFVAINCSSVVPTLLESEFFGHEKGAFTGADTEKIGKFEYAEDGTVFLDEIGDMNLELQGKLLRVLQEEEFIRVGGLEPIPLKARIIAATHRTLEDYVATGKFRQDLFYRLSVSTITLPSLRERRNDIPMLIKYLLGKICVKLACPPASIEKDAIECLKNYDWPGNVRELENVLTRAVALTAKGHTVTKKELCLTVTKNTASYEEPDQSTTLADAEKKHIEKKLRENTWNISRTARILNISPTTLRKKISDFNLKRPD